MEQRSGRKYQSGMDLSDLSHLNEFCRVATVKTLRILDPNENFKIIRFFIVKIPLIRF